MNAFIDFVPNFGKCLMDTFEHYALDNGQLTEPFKALLGVFGGALALAVGVFVLIYIFERRT